MGETNELTKLLLKAGYTREDPPDFVEQWNDFYGGWTYGRKLWPRLVFETPCGLLVSGEELYGGTMSYMGVDWTFENNNYTVCCPKFNREPCELNHELLREPTGSREQIIHCACRLSNKAYDYETSLEKAHDDVWRESKELFAAFGEQKKNRACRRHSRYNRTKKAWRMNYDPIRCADHNTCRHCIVLQAELSEKKGNVYYDVKTSWIEKGAGLLPDENRTVIKKGVKLLKHQASATLCEAIVKYAGWRIRQDKSRLQFHDRVEYPSMRREVLNIRCESRPSRDLLQDLQDIQEGVHIIHASDEIREKKEAKRQRKALRQKRRLSSLEKKIRAFGYDGMEEKDRYRSKKLFGCDRIREIETAAALAKISDYEQITLLSDKSDISKKIFSLRISQLLLAFIIF